MRESQMDAGIQILRESQADDILDATGLACRVTLYDFSSRTSFGELFLNSFSVSLGNTFLDRLGRAIHQIFRFFQAQSGNRAHNLDYVNLAIAYSGKHHSKLGLL